MPTRVNCLEVEECSWVFLGCSGFPLTGNVYRTGCHKHGTKSRNTIIAENRPVETKYVIR